jgi:hypothetical protein
MEQTRVGYPVVGLLMCVLLLRTLAENGPMTWMCMIHVCIFD